MSRLWAGMVAGGAVALMALLETGGWTATNLGLARWLFLAVAVAFALNLGQLRAAAAATPDNRSFARVARLDQLTDIHVHLFVGIGVVWTAIGMRDALVAALADPAAALDDSAGDVLRALVDGGILVALTTTIVGGLGGYAMKLVKALVAGGALQAFYEQHGAQDLQALLTATRRIDQRLDDLARRFERRGETAEPTP